MHQCQETWRLIALILHLQTRRFLLRQCAQSNLVNHLLRSVPPSLHKRALAEFDDALQDATDTLLAIDTSSCWPQVSNATSFGGFGLRSSRLHSAGAYIAEYEGSADALEKLRAAINDPALVLPDGAIEQSKYGQLVSQTQFDRLLAATAEPYHQARLRGVSAKSSAVCLNVIPSPSLGLAIPNAEHHILTLWWLGLRVYGAAHLCPICRSAKMDANGYHALTCRHGGHLGIRHHGIRDEVFRSSQTAQSNGGTTYGRTLYA